VNPNPLNIQVDLRSDVPIYIQIVEQIRHLVASGQLNPGDQLPTVRQLAAELRINFNTVARAYRILDEADLISTQQGRGTYIWDQPSSEASQRLRQESLQALTRRYLSQSSRLGFSPAEVAEQFLSQLSLWQAGETPAPDEQ
jgi:GntR family transcriptional regulator